MAVMKQENDTKRTSREVFEAFAPLEEGFVKTLIPMKEMCPLGDPVARSQARRILRRLEEFREVVFDFHGVGFMGQGFADEVFRVFQDQHPDVKLTVINANASVQGMIVEHKYTIKDTQDEIYIEKDLPDEYAGSKYTYSLMGANAKAKANAVQGLPELLEIAKGKHYRENSGKKHIRNAAYGWYRFDSRFAIPVYNGKGNTERYNVYHASLLVRHAKDGRLYLYDMIDIKKETGNPF